jgi:hypothetical protein
MHIHCLPNSCIGEYSTSRLGAVNLLHCLCRGFEAALSCLKEVLFLYTATLPHAGGTSFDANSSMNVYFHPFKSSFSPGALFGSGNVVSEGFFF